MILSQSYAYSFAHSRALYIILGVLEGLEGLEDWNCQHKFYCQHQFLRPFTLTLRRPMLVIPRATWSHHAPSLTHLLQYAYTVLHLE
eukprot:5798973-Pyramimonas_sp.AAC.1